MKRVYIAGPITRTDYYGSQFANVRAGIRAGERLLAAGHAPYVPHLNFIWEMMHPHETHHWYALDNKWIEVCDALVRLPGDSPGADAEVALAERLGIPVYQGVEHFLQEGGA